MSRIISFSPWSKDSPKSHKYCIYEDFLDLAMMKVCVSDVCINIKCLKCIRILYTVLRLWQFNQCVLCAPLESAFIILYTII